MKEVFCANYDKVIDILLYESLSDDTQDSLQIFCDECRRKAHYRSASTDNKGSTFYCTPHPPSECSIASKSKHKPTSEDAEIVVLLREQIKSNKKIRFPVDDYVEPGSGLSSKVGGEKNARSNDSKDTTRSYVVKPSIIVPESLSLRRALLCIDEPEFWEKERLFITTGDKGEEYFRKASKLFRRFEDRDSTAPYAYYGAIRSACTNPNGSLSVWVEGCKVEVVVSSAIAVEMLRRSNLSTTEAPLLVGSRLIVYGYYDEKERRIRTIESTANFYAEPVKDEEKETRRQFIRARNNRHNSKPSGKITPIQTKPAIEPSHPPVLATPAERELPVPLKSENISVDSKERQPAVLFQSTVEPLAQVGGNEQITREFPQNDQPVRSGFMSWLRKIFT